MSKLCRHLKLPMPKDLHRSPHFKHWSALNLKFICFWQVQLDSGGCSFVHRYVRITGLLSAPVIAFKNWELDVCLACNYPCSFDKSQNILKQICILGLLGGGSLNPQDRGLKSLPSWRLRGMYALHHVSVCICIKAANTIFDLSNNSK